ncbi:hypothetical protein [Pedobacter sp. JY14-1]|uniref:hypothetical protein n=1 Tax=Pedobacter sp. JY14-1 TaxID=3034151 RepID=UPI0023E1C7E0|nr:hypothetical protein [Pedobacter sp. JY14-1]
MIIACVSFSVKKVSAANLVASEYITSVTFPANFQVGRYTEFLAVGLYDAGSSGNYEISISYTRSNVAAAATYLASISHANPALWREVGRVNSNGYGTNGSSGHNFTIDCNTEYAAPRFRIRAINTLGITSEAITVNIKVRAINNNGAWTPLNVSGTDLTVTKFLPMTNDWSLYVGNDISNDGAQLAIKAIENGNVGIGTATPAEKLSVNGKIRSKEVKIEITNWPDYVFAKDYKLPTLTETETHIKEKGHLPGIPSAAEVKENGVELGEMNKKLLEKIEELTLHLIEMKKENEDQKTSINGLINRIQSLENKQKNNLN